TSFCDPGPPVSRVSSVGYGALPVGPAPKAHMTRDPIGIAKNGAESVCCRRLSPWTEAWEAKGDKERKSFRCIFPQKYRVDTICCFTYTLAVVFRRFWPGGEREVFAPRNAEKRNGVKKSGRNGAPAPQSRASLSAV